METNLQQHCRVRKRCLASKPIHLGMLAAIERTPEGVEIEWKGLSTRGNSSCTAHNLA